MCDKVILDKHGNPLPPHVPSEKPPRIKWQCWEVRGFPITNGDGEAVLELRGIQVGDEVFTISTLGTHDVRAQVVSTNIVEPADGVPAGKAQALSGRMLKFLEWDMKRGWVCVGSGNIDAIKKLELK